LDDVLFALDTHVAGAVRDLFCGLDALARAATCEEFATQVVPSCRSHPLYARFAADPFVRRCRERPRGYAGDAVMLDYMYEGLSEQERRAVSAEGRALFATTAESSEGARAVRERRTILARMIDAAASQAVRPRVLSVACGHLREAGACRAVKQGGVAELIALDQDAESLCEIERAAYGTCVKPIKAGIGAILRGHLDLGCYDLIYTAGLYDYLSQPLAQALTARLFSMLNPGGRLLIGNFVQGFGDSAFMDAIMDWRLVLRSHTAMRGLFATVPSADFVLQIYEDSLRCVLYAEATRRGH
jgi:hypothetical protein